MTRTGWTEDPAPRPAMPVTSLVMRATERGPGDTLAIAQAKAAAAEAREIQDEAARAVDPDEHAANLIARGYQPGMMSQLSRQLADTTADLEAEQEKIERGQRRAEHVHRDLEAGRISGLDAVHRLDGDFGDLRRAEQLERRCASLRRQIAETTAVMAPQAQRDADPFEAAASRAHQAFAETTRAMLAAAQAGPPAPRPFASRSASPGVAARSESCQHCIDQGVDDETSFLLHSDPERHVPVTPPPAASGDTAAYAPGGVITTGWDAQRAEADRLVALGFSREVAEYASVPAGAAVSYR